MKAVTMEDRMYSTCRAISSPFTNRDNSIYSLLKAGHIKTVRSLQMDYAQVLWVCENELFWFISMYRSVVHFSLFNTIIVFR